MGVTNRRIVDAEYLEDNFDEEDLAEAGIYTQKYHEVTTTSFAYDSATVEAYDSATVKAYENSYVEDLTGNIRPQSGYAVIKDYYNHKIYIKKGRYQIIEVD